MTVKAERRAIGVVVVVVLTVVCGGCLQSGGHPKPLLVPALDGPDPAAVAVGTGAFVYTTESGGKNVPAWPFDLLQNRPLCCVTEALPTANLPASATNARVWAPAVRHVGTDYVLMWSGSPAAGRQPGNQNCIFAATSASASGPFVAVAAGSFVTGLCDADKCTAYLDPDIFYDNRGGHYWLYYSKQTYPGINCDTPGAAVGELFAQQLSNDTRSLVGAPYRLIRIADVTAHVTTCGLGTFPRLENPAMVADPNNGYDLLASLGSYNDPCYSTIEMACLSVNGNCVLSKITVANLAGTSSLVGTGGASLMNDGSPDNNFIVFHAWTGTFADARYPYGDTTHCIQSDGAPCTTGTTPNTGVALSVHSQPSTTFRGTAPRSTLPGTPNRYTEPR